MKKLISSLLVAAVFVSLGPSSASAWGRKGHAVVAQIAEDNLTEEAYRHVRALLDADGSKDMASVASWADQKDVKRLPTSPMHTVRMTMDNAPYDEHIDCPDGRCVVDAIKRDEQILADQTATLDQQIWALKELIHFVGDVHQPLHTVSNIGGQPVKLNGEKTKLHTVWDEFIVESRHMSYRSLARTLESGIIGLRADGGPEDWAVEGRNIAVNEIYFEVAPAGKHSIAVELPSDYCDRHWPTVKARLQQAGLRLAGILNRVYEDPSANF